MDIRQALVAIVIGFSLAGCGGSGDEAPDNNTGSGGTGSGGNNTGSGQGTGNPASSAFFSDDNEPVGLSTRASNADCHADNFNFGNATPSSIRLERVFPQLSFNQGLILLQPPGDSSHWLVGQRQGLISSILTTDSSSQVFADLSSRINSGANERGLLGLAFHPDYPARKEIYVSYTDQQGASVISRFDVDTANFTLDTQSETILLTQDQPYTNHNGGHIAFGPDGYLYIGIGDGGSGGDPQNHAQNTKNLLGAMLRVDVSDGSLKIPQDNPFSGNASCGPNSDCPEIWAWGLRNPWRWSFDSGTGKLWAGDVGQNAQEEINIIEQGKNYGWRCYEGFADYNTDGCGAAENYEQPVASYERSEGVSVTGGYVYRGSALPFLSGHYLYGDFASGHIWGLDSTDLSKPATRLIDSSGRNISTFAQGLDKELYIMDYYGGGIYKIVADLSNSNIQQHDLSETGCMQAQDPSQVGAGVIPYTVNAALWSDNAGKNRWFAIPDGSQIAIDGAGDWQFPNGSVLIKEFELDNKPVETRFLVRGSDGSWQGYSYAWNADGDDAELLRQPETRNYNGQNWNFPVGQCFQCHTRAAGIALGLETAQLNKSQTWPTTGVQANQLLTLSHIDMLNNTQPQNISSVGTLSDWSDSQRSLAERARSYLHANCSGCHQPGSTDRSGTLDFRYSASLEDMGACNQVAQLGSSTPGQKIIDPGNGSQSVMVERMSSSDQGLRMPPVGTSMVDSVGVALIRDWIDSLSGCQ